MKKIKTDYVIIGAGLSGMVLKHFLKNQNVVILDDNPGGYKIGESIIPEHFRHPEMQKQLYRISKLPSFTPKYGTTFIADGSIASFPLPQRESTMAMHIFRSELETEMMNDWNIEVTRERVKDIDFESKIVITDKTEYEFKHQVIDCSGPAMVIARLKNSVKDMWPAYATWRYYDVLEDDSQKFYDEIKKRGWDWRRYDVFHRRLLDSKEIRGWMPSRSTILTKVKDGLWTWQIPLYKGKILSFGVVSKLGPVSAEEMDDILNENKAPNYVKLAPRKLDKSGHLNRLHMRNMFAKIAEIPPGNPNYILVSDAYAFADPIYSVGTGLAVNKAIEVATILNQRGWNEETINEYNAYYNEQLERAVKGFEFWYDGKVIKDDAAAIEVQEQLLIGNAFQSRIGIHYADALLDAGLPPSLREEIEDKFFVEWFKPPVTQDVRSLLGIGEKDVNGNWLFLGAFPAVGGIVSRWRHTKIPEMSILVSNEKGALQLSYMSYFEESFPIKDAELESLLVLFRESFQNHTKEWLDLLAQG